MVTHCFKVFDFQFRDFVTDFIKAANLSDFKQTVTKEHKELIYKIFMKIFEKIEGIDEEWMDELFSDIEYHDDEEEEEAVSERNNYIYLSRKDPAQCSRRDVCVNQRLTYIVSDESQSMLKDFSDYVTSNTDGGERTDESADGKVMKQLTKDLGFREEEMKSSIAEFKYKITCAALDYLLEFACQDPSDGDEKTLLETCCTFLKSTLLSNFGYCLDLKWHFSCEHVWSLRSNYVKCDLLLHIILAKLNLEVSYQAKLEALFKNSLCFFYTKQVCAKLFVCLLETKLYIEGNTSDFEKKIHEKMVLHIIYYLVHGKLSEDWDFEPGNLGYLSAHHIFDVLEVVDFSLISFYGRNLIKHLAGQFSNDIKNVPVKSIFKVLERPFQLGCLDLFIYEVLYKVYLISQTSNDLAKCLELNGVIQYALSSRFKDTLLAIIKKRGEKDGVPIVPPLLPKIVYRRFMSLDHKHFLKAASMISSPLKEMDLTADLCGNKFCLPSWVACFTLGLKMIQNENPESAFPQSLSKINSPSGNLSSSLVSLCFQSEDFSCFLWDCLIPDAWNLLKNKDDQAKKIQKFLDGHLYTLRREGNISRSIIAFTENLLKITPSPFTPDFHKRCGDHFHMWAKTDTLFRLEEMISTKFELPTFKLLSEVYSRLGEQDMLCGLLKLFPDKYVAAGVTLEQQGLFEEAKAEYNKGLFTNLNICKERSEKCARELGEWPLNLDKWKPLEVACICDELKNRLNSMIKDVNEFKTISFNSMESCDGLCDFRREKSNFEKIFKSVEKFLIEEWKIMPQTISETHVDLLQAVLKIENTRNAVTFLTKAKEGFIIFNPVQLPTLFNMCDPSPHESSSFWHEVQGYKMHLWKQLKIRNVNERFQKLCMDYIQKVKVQLANVMIMYRFPAIYVQRLFGTSCVEDVEAFKLLNKATYQQITFSKDEQEIKTLLQSLSGLCTQANTHSSNQVFASIESKIQRDLSFLRKVEGKPKALEEFWCERNFVLVEKQFLACDVDEPERMTFGKYSIEGLLEDCRIKRLKDSGASIARIIFFLTVDKRLEDEVSEDKWSIIPLSYWLPWISELVNISLDEAQLPSVNNRNSILKIIKEVGKEYPQSLYVCLQAIRSNSSGQLSTNVLEDISSCLDVHHPTLKSSLDMVYEQLSGFKEEKSEPMLQNLIEVLDELHGVSYFSLKEEIPFDMTDFWRNLRYRLHQNPTCAGFESMRKEIDRCSIKKEGIHSVFVFLSKWIEFYSKLFPLNTRIDRQPLLKFHNSNHEIDLLTFGLDQAYSNDLNKVKIFQFLPQVKFVKKFQDYTYRFYIKGSDGKIYPYTFVSKPFLQPIRRENNFNHFMSCLNLLLDEQRETASRHLRLKIPDIITLSPKVYILRDSPSSSLFSEICVESIPQGFDPVVMFYKSAATLFERNKGKIHMFLKKLYTYPTKYLKDWAKRTFENVADYLRFRKEFARSLALFGFLTHTFGVSSQYPSNMLVHKDEGCITNIGYSFDYRKNGIRASDENIPFRLTPNISAFLTPVGVRGMFIPAMTATASCLRKNGAFVTRLLELFLLHEVLFMPFPDAPDPQPEPATREEITINILEAAKSSQRKIYNYGEDYRPTRSDDDDVDKYNIPSIVKRATDVNRLSFMDPVWLPWF